MMLSPKVGASGGLREVSFLASRALSSRENSTLCLRWELSYPLKQWLRRPPSLQLRWELVSPAHCGETDPHLTETLLPSQIPVRLLLLLPPPPLSLYLISNPLQIQLTIFPRSETRAMTTTSDSSRIPPLT